MVNTFVLSYFDTIHWQGDYVVIKQNRRFYTINVIQVPNTVQEEP